LNEATPEGYLRPSEAARILASGIFGGGKRPELVSKFKAEFPGARIHSGPQREQAAERLMDAVTKGELPLYIWNRSARNVAPNSSVDHVPVKIARRLRPNRGGLPDYPYRVSTTLIDSLREHPTLLAAFQGGLMGHKRAGAFLLSNEEFRAWYERERSRGKWPSQRSSIKPRRGRRSSTNEALISLVVEAVNEGKWAADQGTKALCRLLEGSGHAVPSHDTMHRLIDRLFIETGIEALRRKRRRSRREPRQVASTPSN
jgi:hypothetical protein